MLKQLVEHYKQDGAHPKLAYRLAADHIDGLLTEGQIKPEDFSIRQMFEELVDLPAGLRDDAEAVAEAINTSGFPTIASKVIHKKVIDSYTTALGSVAELVTEDDATNTEKEIVAGMEAADTTPLLRRQGMAYEETGFGEKFWQISMHDFGRMISLTREVIFEDKTGKVMQTAQGIGKSVGNHKAKMIIQTITGQVRTAIESTYGGAVYKGTVKTAANMYADTHATTFDGQVNDNLAASNALADYTDIDNILQLFAKMKDESGEAIEVTPTHILVPLALQTLLTRILSGVNLLGSALVPAMNPIQTLGNFKPVSSIYMADTSTWFMGDFAKQILWLNVFPLETKAQGADSNLAFTNQIVARFRVSYHGGCGHTDYRHIVKATS